jgi:hypothetical protein
MQGEKNVRTKFTSKRETCLSSTQDEKRNAVAQSYDGSDWIAHRKMQGYAKRKENARANFTRERETRLTSVRTPTQSDAERNALTRRLRWIGLNSLKKKKTKKHGEAMRKIVRAKFTRERARLMHQQRNASGLFA